MARIRSIDEWLARLSTSNEDEQALAAEALGDALGAEDAALRERTAQLLLEELARPGSRAQGPILSVLQSAWWPPPPRLADSAMRAVTAALTRMDAADSGVEDAALVLANVCRELPTQLPTLEAALGHDHPAVRRAAAGAVGRVGELAVPLLPRLLERLKDEEPVVDSALESLGAFALLAPDVATPALLEQVRKASGARLYLALASLRGMLEELRYQKRAAPRLTDVEAALLRAAEDAESPIRLESVALLGLVGPASPTALTALRRHLRDASPTVAAVAAVALLRQGAEPKEPLSTLEAQLRASDAELQGAALSALEGVDSATLGLTKGMLEAVVQALTGPTRDAVSDLLDALG